MSEAWSELRLFDGTCPKCGAELTEVVYDVRATEARAAEEWLRCHCGRCGWDGTQRCLDAGRGGKPAALIEAARQWWIGHYAWDIEDRREAVDAALRDAVGVYIDSLKGGHDVDKR